MNSVLRYSVWRPLWIALFMSIVSIAHAAPVGSALERPSVVTTMAARSYLLGIAQAGERLVAVGERGIVVLSDDAGVNWRQVQAPVSVTLTAVRFADAMHGYAVGHGGSVLVTTDAGETWTLSLDGRRAAEIVLAAAREKGDARSVADAERLVADGPDKPFLDVLVLDPLNALAVGAYGLALATADGGKTWSSWGDRIPNPRAFHLNVIRGHGQKIIIVGEQGLVRISEDGGATFSIVQTPYRGSYFTAEMPSENVIVVAGLRGNALHSEDGGKTWTSLASPVEASITASAIQPDGQLVLVNQAGLVMHEQGGRLVPINSRPLPPLNGVLAGSNAGIFVLSQQGVAVVHSGDKK